MDYLVDNLKIITGITQIEIPPMVNQLIENLKTQIQNKSFD